MPFVSFTTTKTLTLTQEVSLKDITGKLITILPGKTEDRLMVHIEDNQVMYFKGQELDCMKIEVQLFHHLELDDKKKFVKALMKEVETITNIPVSQQYLSIEEYDYWGKDGELCE